LCRRAEPRDDRSKKAAAIFTNSTSHPDEMKERTQVAGKSRPSFGQDASPVPETQG